MRYIKTALLAFSAVLLAGALAQPVQAGFSFDLAYSSLNQHGSWLVSAQYGRVWQPREYSREWNPYYDGHWVDTDLGWSWVSDYEWGSIPYHYGTWVADPLVGWVWIPGNTWAPSWVTFRTGPDYIGWAPVAPGYSIGASIELGGGVNFTFVSSRDFLSPRLRPAIIPVSQTNVFINKTTVVNNIRIENNVVVNRGPDVAIVERATGQRVRQERIENVARVAPYDHVDRAQLAVDPERVKRGVRVAEPVPESTPLPVSDKRGEGGGKNPANEAQTPSNARPEARQNVQDPAAEPKVVTPTGTPDTAREQRIKENADQGAKGQPNARPNAEPVTRSQANANARAEQATRAQANAKARADQQTARAEATAKARSDQAARAQATAKARADAKAEAKAKKNNPDKKDQSPSKDSTSEPKP